MDRDTQFLGFAASLAAEIANTDGWHLADVEKLIARRAYDLAHHVLRCNGIDIGFWDRRASDLYENEIITDLAGIPDMPELPEVEVEHDKEA